jgi:hypothetical protein
MLPVVVLGALGGFDVIQRHREAASASDVQTRVARVKQALQLYLGLVSEDAASEFIAVAATFGMTPTQARQCWGSTARAGSTGRRWMPRWRFPAARSKIAWRGCQRCRRGSTAGWPP